MLLDFEELDYQQTPHGEISLRRRAEPRLDGKIIHEVKLGDEFLMSSLFPEAEIQLANICLAALKGNDWDIVVGGLGLGYTAVAALENLNVKSMMVIDVMQPVIDWHRQGLVPLGEKLNQDKRCTLIHNDFFAIASSEKNGFFADDSSKLIHAILLDIDHTPSYWLNPENSRFYTQTALKNMTKKLHEGGVFGLWSDDPPDEKFIELLDSVFDSTESHIINFANPYTGKESSNTVYLAYK